MKHLKIISVVGTRPNFIKISPFVRAIQIFNEINPDPLIQHKLVHTGQHYDKNLSKNFFNGLNIPKPDVNLGVGSGSHAYQVGHTMIEFEKLLKREKPDWVVVVGDVNATLACSITTKKEHVNLCHIEAGLRSGDMEMPEEINRIVTDRISDLLLTPDKLSLQNLEKEGIDSEKIRFVGNIMIDTLSQNLDTAKRFEIIDIIAKYGMDQQANLNEIYKKYRGTIDSKDETDDFAVLTLHRPSNVDCRKTLEELVTFFLEVVCEDMMILWPVHPRTEKMLTRYDLWGEVLNSKCVVMLQPVGYHEMLKLNLEATVLFTDSGGLQEESTVLGTPCIVLRENTERPITLKANGGTCELVGNDPDKIKSAYYSSLSEDMEGITPDLWDGKTAERCLEAIVGHS